jgi:hypothetical protein
VKYEPTSKQALRKFIFVGLFSTKKKTTDHRFWIFTRKTFDQVFQKKKEKLTSHGDSPPSIAFIQVFETIIPFILGLVSGQSGKYGHTSKQASKQADNLCLLNFSTRKRTATHVRYFFSHLTINARFHPTHPQY